MVENHHHKAQKVGISQKAVVFNKEGKVLALRRSETDPRRPFSWDLPGGDLDYGEDLGLSIIREIQEETGIVVNEVVPFDVEGHVTKKEEYWVTIAYIARCESPIVKLSYEHDIFQWVTPEEFSHLQSVERFHRFVRNAVLKMNAD